MARKPKIFLLVFIFTFFSAQNHAAAASKERFSVEALWGYYDVPGALLGMDKSIVDHPNHLGGEVRGVRGSVNFKKHWSLGVQAFRLMASGGGEWARSDTAEILAANNVAGVITGRTDWELQGISLDVERRFLKASSPVRPFVRLGGGLGEVDVHFRGKFVGHETKSGFDFPVEEVAEDRVKRKIPIVLVEVGLRFNLGRRVHWSMSGYWNTGYGARLGAGLRF